MSGVSGEASHGTHGTVLLTIHMKKGQVGRTGILKRAVVNINRNTFAVKIS